MTHYFPAGVDQWVNKLAKDLYRPLAPIERECFVTDKQLGYTCAMNKGLSTPCPWAPNGAANGNIAGALAASLRITRRVHNFDLTQIVTMCADTDMLEENGEELAATNNTPFLSFRPFKIKMLRLTAKQKFCQAGALSIRVSFRG